MKPSHLITLLSVAAIAGSTFVTFNSAQACPFSSKLSANSVNQSSPSINPTTNNSNLAGFTLLSGLLAVGGIYLSRRLRHSDPVIDRAEYEALEMIDTPVVEQVERELVGSRK
ncbi:hypothetical protein [Gloeocapsopsis sp. IPPAS B-1203]|uniref:hypothetical protein n=1 Tax=Gloeocapsopsis sp. IPPAS B-1203 TaxID=2049454 RepID=UPI000C18EF5B|nr:hypothetical protein [Gloeocapsopsis sp. IPPAS B-1203]PIG92957.1 hypothetical protein CSQ79_12075 [Gloeocapsopsis sp. IPPAS B-1203]